MIRFRGKLGMYFVLICNAFLNFAFALMAVLCKYHPFTQLFP